METPKVLDLLILKMLRMLLKAADSLNGQKFDNKEWYVGKAQKKHELKQRFEQTIKEAEDKLQGLNLYIKNLDDTIDDESLKELFSSYGTITSCKVMRDPNGTSKGSGFVAFSTSEEASRALVEMNGKMVASKPLYVALAQRKEDRRSRLQAQFSQMRQIAMALTVAPRMPIYPPGGPGLGQQVFYAWIWVSAATCTRNEAWWGNFFMPMVQQGQQGQRPGGRRATGSGQQNQQPVPIMQQQMMPRGRVYRYPPGRNASDGSMSGIGGGGMVSVPYDMSGGMSLRDAGISQPIPVGALASALANASPPEQRTLLGENL